MRVSRATLRILALLLLAVTLFQLTPVGVLLAAMSLLALCIGLDSGLSRMWWKRVSGLKWFFAAIFVLYMFGGWRLDGQPDWQEASHRVGVLITLVGGVVVLLSGLPAPELADGISTLLRPLQTVGVPTDVFARRLGLTLDAVAHMQGRIRSIDRSAGFQTVAAVCQEAEVYSPPPHSASASGNIDRLDWILVAWAVLLLIGAIAIR